MRRQIEVNCCIELEGQKFCANGSVITEEKIVAYLSSDGQKVTTWRGQTLSRKVRILSKRWQQTWQEYGYFLRFEYNGFIYSGYCCGEGAIIYARKTKMKTIWD